MFTSRAEYRILLRQDNADVRLTPIAEQLGIDIGDRMNRVRQKLEVETKIRQYLDETSISPEQINHFLVGIDSAPIVQKGKLSKILLRPNIDLQNLSAALPELRGFLSHFEPEFVNCAEIAIKYESYVEKEQELANKMNRLEDIRLAPNFDYAAIAALSLEAREKLGKVRPSTLGQASRMSGVSPSDISVLMVLMGR
jgi:tRNA uridine 5-carboxymethylaminomethyl modification enzyme